MRPALALALAVAAASLVGCGGAGTARPGSAVDAYAQALERRDYDRAYELMSTRYKREHTREEFIARMRESPEEARETAARLRQPGRQVEVRATVDYGELGDQLVLVREKDGWYIADDPLLFYPQDTPQNAIRSFVRAVELKRWDVVLRFVPNEYRKHMDEAKVRAQFEGKQKDQNLDKALRLLKGSLGTPVEQQGDQARLPYGTSFEIRLRREDGIWKVEDPY